VGNTSGRKPVEAVQLRLTRPRALRHPPCHARVAGEVHRFGTPFRVGDGNRAVPATWRLPRNDDQSGTAVDRDAAVRRISPGTLFATVADALPDGLVSRLLKELVPGTISVWRHLAGKR